MSVPVRLILLLALGAALFGGLDWLLRPDPEQRNFQFFPDMARSLAAESFSACPVLPGGVTQQPLVDGVVVRGHLPFEYGSTPEEAERAGRELTNPFAADDAAALARGAERYALFCAVCHAADGNGATMVVQRGMLPPPSLLADRARALADGQIFHVLTRGQGNMSAYANLLDAADRWKVVLHLRSMQKKGAP